MTLFVRDVVRNAFRGTLEISVWSKRSGLRGGSNRSVRAMKAVGHFGGTNPNPPDLAKQSHREKPNQINVLSNSRTGMFGRAFNQGDGFPQSFA
jgi:hypothetical protein